VELAGTVDSFAVPRYMDEGDALAIGQKNQHQETPLAGIFGSHTDHPLHTPFPRIVHFPIREVHRNHRLPRHCRLNRQTHRMATEFHS